MSDEVYCYPPDFVVLRNRFGLRDGPTLDQMERVHVAFRFGRGVPTGSFDLGHLKAIHRHLFQDVYEWAGEVRTVEISKGGSQFQFRRFIEAGMADVHRRLVEQRFLQDLDVSRFAAEAGRMIGDVNYVHPFREGNGRTQLAYLRQLAKQAGHSLDPHRIEPKAWIAASIEAHKARYEAMERCILEALLPDAGPSDIAIS